MAVLECKMCGGKLILVEGQNIAECESCGTRQTVPTADNEKKLIQFERAGWLRRNFEFDKAAGIYEAIVSDYRRESEAYWGLVLCKYGIEYVDDPATGKKIPTCHRSSYDSVMDDDNFIQACEYADVVARKLYREEAKRIEEIRKGIIEVSEKEAPYDIFICYKETDENGDRTLDSVLAQDLYTALAEKGYRVFFSRITLKGELGSAYEPRIFAALNSAKVMLAVGTDYEYFNAVWVKNEWSRYLQICAKDKSKHLIPCYKGIDAYDMPREFKPLQAVDLGQMGAVQDILFNMEKYIPLKKQPVVQEKVVVGTVGGNNKVTALLERGNMALEDGDWAKADSFFEDVLNNDAKNAQAYIGKTLAQEKCRTMDAFARKRKEATQNVRSETLELQPNHAHIEEMAQKYSLPGYVEQSTIRELYRFDLRYSSEVSGRKQQYREEEIYWANHKLLSRAEKFAVGVVAQNLQAEKKVLFSHLKERIQKAEAADAKAVEKLRAAYDAHIAQADKQAETIYSDGLSRREANYRGWLKKAKQETHPEILLELAAAFDDLGEYQDSKNLAEHCRKRAADEQAKIDAENERQRVIAEQKRKAQQKRIKTVSIVAAAAIVLVAVVSALVTKVIIPGNAYKEAVALMENGAYQEAMVAFDALGAYKDSKDKKEECAVVVEKAEAERRAAEEIENDYQYAVSVLSYGIDVDYSKIKEAHDIFERLGDYKDSQTYLAQFVKRHIQTTRTPNAKDYPKNYWYDEYGREYGEGYVYDERGLLVHSGDWTNEYNDNGQLIRCYDGGNYTFEFSYDEHGNQSVLKTIYTATAGKNKGEQTISYETYEYQYENDLVMNKKAYRDDHKIYYSGNYKYNSEGNVVESTITYYRYQTIGNSTDTAYYWYTYNEDGSRKQIEYKRGKDTHIETFIYDWVWAPNHG